MTITEIFKPKDLPFNPGEIVEVNGWPRWKTSIGPFELTLDIVKVATQETGKHLGIASFVVMEQKQPFLDYAGSLLAQSITNHLTDSQILLITTETKGSYFVSHVWRNLSEIIGNQLLERVVVFRKGEPKVYMQRPIIFNNQEIQLPVIKYRSITSASEQTLTPSPNDAEYLLQALDKETTAIIADDFVGQGGTVAAICHYFESLRLPPPKIAAVVGSDGNLYQKTFTDEGINITLIPQPFPLRLPTFIRSLPNGPWQINMEASIV